MLLMLCQLLDFAINFRIMNFLIFGVNFQKTDHARGLDHTSNNCAATYMKRGRTLLNLHNWTA
jgi:hypothetical protein